MFNLCRLPMDVKYKELDYCAEYAAQVIFSDWDSKDFDALFVSLKHYPSLEKYIEFEEEHLRPYLLSLIGLPTKARKQQEKTSSERFRLESTYAHWRMATIALMIQNRLLELKIVRTSSVRKTVETSLNFLSDLDLFYEFSPVWLSQFGDTSPFLNEAGEEMWYPDDKN
ncbi:hypothetical protein [Haemophilus haemolyticus]|uniref:hypothetical protein n=1 Tax=Haemophilus haemolyticus TaxID=726 RepID=UPI001290043D|nr:hypothetical protein [Haemophilus haemolyticus]